MKKHKAKIVNWEHMNLTLSFLQDQGCEILALGPIKEHQAFIHYTEPVITKKQNSSPVDKNAIEKAYQKYPRKIGKKGGIEKAVQLVRGGLAIDQLEKAIENFAEFTKGRETKHIPYFSTFMTNQLDDFLPDNYSPEKAKSRYDLL